ncbi:hypothetical protein AgCh_022922 [Apium graveolens]
MCAGLLRVFEFIIESDEVERVTSFQHQFDKQIAFQYVQVYNEMNVNYAYMFKVPQGGVQKLWMWDSDEQNPSGKGADAHVSYRFLYLLIRISSSSLLLKALRREAAEGVNVYMVVHQPSYTLYKMFDDLVLLSKGGLTAYHGPVKKFHSNHDWVSRYKYINSGSRFDIRSHWEKTLLMNEIMTGSVYTRSVVSKMTLDFLEDSGWYKANYSMADHLESSHNPSIIFVTSPCNNGAYYYN